LARTSQSLEEGEVVVSRTIESYIREQAILNKVLESGKGLVASFNSAREARAFRTNCYAFRALDRKIQSQGTDPMDPRRSQGPYDFIKFEERIDYTKKIFQIVMKNCSTVLEVHGVESLFTIEDEKAVEVELGLPALMEEVELEETSEATTLEEEMKAEIGKTEGS
jgi:hypothetical protein